MPFAVPTSQVFQFENLELLRMQKAKDCKASLTVVKALVYLVGQGGEGI